MNKYVSRGLMTVLFTGGLLALGAGVAHADDTTSGENGIGSGSQAFVELGTPVTISGNSISLLGNATRSGSTSVGSGSSAGGSGASTNGSDSVLGGTQAGLGLGTPVSVTGNSVSVFGDASGSGSTSAGGPTDPAASATTNGSNGTLGGSQLLADLLAPATIEDNSVSVFGDSSSTGPVPESGDGGSHEASLGDLATAALGIEPLATTGPEAILPGLLGALAAIAVGLGIARLPEEREARRR